MARSVDPGGRPPGPPAWRPLGGGLGSEAFFWLWFCLLLALVLPSSGSGSAFFWFWFCGLVLAWFWPASGLDLGARAFGWGLRCGWLGCVAVNSQRGGGWLAK